MDEDDLAGYESVPEGDSASSEATRSTRSGDESVGSADELDLDEDYVEEVVDENCGSARENVIRA